MNEGIAFAKFKTTQNYLSLPEDIKEELDIVTNIFPFKTNNYIVKSLIDWDHIRQDPIFRINFPNRQILPINEYNFLLSLFKNKSSNKYLPSAIEAVKLKLLPKYIFEPSKYIPILDNKPLYGFLHQYQNTIVAIVRPAKTCFAHCTYCLVWPIHVLNECEYGYIDPELPVKYCERHHEVNDIYFTGGDMLSMSASSLKRYIQPLLSVEQLETIRILTRSLSWWPYRFLRDRDSLELLKLFEEIIRSKKHLTLISHISHPKEISTPQAEEAIKKIHATGAVIRCQCPLLKTINDSVDVWVSLLKKEIQLGLIPYYMFTNANSITLGSFEVPLAKAYTIFNETMKKVSGLAKTIHGPVIDHDYCKIEISGIEEIHGEKRFILKCLQSPDPREIGKIATIPYDPDIIDLKKSIIAFR
jgi:L-lysine 2,3-aminomutase